MEGVFFFVLRNHAFSNVSPLDSVGLKQTLQCQAEVMGKPLNYSSPLGRANDRLWIMEELCA